MPNENVYTEAHGFKFPNGTTIPIEDAEARQDISEIKQSLSQLKIHHDTLSGTTDNSGRLFSNYNISNKLIIALLPTEHGKIADQVRLSGNTLCIKYLNSDSMTPFNNQSVTCNFYYVSADSIVEDN